MDADIDKIESLDAAEAAHCWDPLFVTDVPSDCGINDVTLPYLRLGARGLERLCFQLLVQSGVIPRYFGKPGQKQYGIDLVAEAGERRTVYQCKNLGHEPTVPEIREAAEKFRQDWLTDAALPKPEEFVYCCPQAFDDSAENKDYLQLQETFRKEAGVDLARKKFQEPLMSPHDIGL